MNVQVWDNGVTRLGIFERGRILNCDGVSFSLLNALRFAGVIVFINLPSRQGNVKWCWRSGYPRWQSVAILESNGYL